MESVSGIIFQTISYVTFDNIKALEAKKYPFTPSGSLVLDVGGDRRAQYGKQANQFQIVNSTVKIDFAKNVFSALNIFDKVLNNGVLDIHIDVEKKQDLGNTLLPRIIVSIILILFLTTGISSFMNEINP